MKILLIGPPASGKGTLGPLLSEALGVPHITMGGLFRSLPKEHPQYLEVHKYLDAGDFVPVEISSVLVKERLSQEDCAKGFILDGWCRRMVDLEAYEPDFDAVIYINIPKEVVIKRIAGRRMCEADGKVYNIYTLPKEELEKCPGPLTRREDDTEEVALHRWQVQHIEGSLPVIEYFKNKGLIIEVDGTPSPDEVLENALKGIKNHS